MSLSGLENTAALFGLILAAGFIAGRAGFLTKPAQVGLTNLILYVTLPCTIIESFDTEFDPRLLHGMLIALALATFAQAVNQAASILFFKKEPHERRSVFRYALIVCNSGFFGMAVIAALFGGAALSYAAVYLIPQRFAMWSFGIAAFTDEKQKGALAKTLVHPCMIAVYIGMVILTTPVSIPDAIPTDVLGGCTMPLSMLLVGSILSELSPQMLIAPKNFAYTALRLIAIPAISLACCLLFGVSRDITQVCVLMAGMPAGTTAGLLAIKYGADEKLGSALIIVSTIFFFGMLPLWMLVFRAIYPA